MANKLIGINGKPLPSPQRGETPFRKWLYHRKMPARIFESPEEVQDAMADGWVAKPWQVNDPPPPPDPPKADADLTKAELVEKYGLDLEPDRVSKAEIMAAIEELKQAHIEETDPYDDAE